MVSFVPARPAQSEIVTKAAGDGATVNTTTISAEISALSSNGGGILFFPPGTYLTGALTIPSNITLKGCRGISIIKAISSLSASATLLANTTKGSYTNTDINLIDLVIDGNGIGSGASQTRFTELVSLVRITRLRLIGVAVQNVEYIGLGLGGCRDLVLDQCEITGCGYDGTTSNGGSAIWIAAAGGTDSPQKVRMTNCHIHDNLWHGVHFAPEDSVIDNCIFKNNEEAHIYAPVSGAGARKITNNILDSVIVRDVSGNGIEVEGDDVIISGNQINKCETSGVAITDSKIINVSNNHIGNCKTGGVSIISGAASPNQPMSVLIHDNVIYNDGLSSPYGPANSAVRFNDSGGDDVVGIRIYDNEMTGTWDSGLAISGTALAGSGCEFKRNRGAIDLGSADSTILTDGVTAPGTVAGVAQLYVDTSDGDLKVKFGDGTVATVAADT